MTDQNNQRPRNSSNHPNNSNNHQRRPPGQGDSRFSKHGRHRNDRNDNNLRRPEGRDQRNQRNSNPNSPKVQPGRGNRNDFHQRPRPQHQGHSHGNQLDALLIQYDKLMDQYLDSRKKYFEMYARADRNKLFKLEDNYLGSIARLKKFERELRPWQLEHLKKHRLNLYPLDTIFSEGHKEELEEQKGNSVELSPIGLGVNFHLTLQQQDRQQYKEDTEQTTGTMEDYLAYKNSVGR